MPMPAYPIYCSTKDCKQLAQYKIAATWSDGVARELKTYGLCCAECLPVAFRQSRERYAACRLSPGETLEAPGIFLLQRGHRDRGLQRLTELETQLLESESGSSPGGS
jgi:hypothetical protein